jgi:hypothetical protein
MSSKSSSLSSLTCSSECEEEISQMMPLEPQKQSWASEVRQEDDRMTAVKPKISSSNSMEVGEEVDGMIGVESEKARLDLTEVEVVDGMDVVRSSNPGSDLSEDGKSENGESENGEGSLMVGVQWSKEPSSDSAEDDEDQHQTGVDSTHSLDSGDEEDNSIIGVKEANPVIGVEPNEMTLESNTAMLLEPPRRSARLAPEKSQPSLKVAVATKPFARKSKRVLKKNAILLEVGVSNNPGAKLVPNVFQGDSEDESQKLSNIPKAKVGSLFICHTAI